MKILVADDHALFREGLRQMVQQLADTVSVLGAHDWQTTLAQAAQNLDLALIDLNNPGKLQRLDAVVECHRRRGAAAEPPPPPPPHAASVASTNSMKTPVNPRLLVMVFLSSCNEIVFVITGATCRDALPVHVSFLF